MILILCVEVIVEDEVVEKLESPLYDSNTQNITHLGNAIEFLKKKIGTAQQTYLEIFSHICDITLDKSLSYIFLQFRSITIMLVHIIQII